MASDWIKIEVVTPHKPEVIAMSARLKKDTDTVLGKLVTLWCWADLNSVAGQALPITRAWIDSFVRQRGFSVALEEVGWLSGSDGELLFCNFDRHNGSTAKKRASEQRKKQGQRRDSCPEPVPSPAGQKGDKRGDQTETETDISTPLPPEGGASAGEIDYLGIVNSYPKLSKQRESLEHLRSAIEAGEDPRAIIAHIRAINQRVREIGANPLNQYFPGSASYFRERRWNEDPKAILARWEKQESETRL